VVGMYVSTFACRRTKAEEERNTSEKHPHSFTHAYKKEKKKKTMIGQLLQRSFMYKEQGGGEGIPQICNNHNSNNKQ